MGDTAEPLVPELAEADGETVGPSLPDQPPAKKQKGNCILSVKYRSLF